MSWGVVDEDKRDDINCCYGMRWWWSKNDVVTGVFDPNQYSFELKSYLKSGEFIQHEDDDHRLQSAYIYLLYFTLSAWDQIRWWWCTKCLGGNFRWKEE